MDDTSQLPHPSRSRSLRKLARLGAFLLMVLLLASACGSDSDGPTVVSTDPTASATAAASSGDTTTDAKPSMAAYSQCMRAHGISDFPDPNAKGELMLEAHPGSDIDPDAPAYQAADQACKPLMPTEAARSDAEKQEFRAKTLKYAQCMRDNGISDFPDPNEDGGIAVQNEPGSDLDPNSAQYQAADKACKQYLPEGGEGRSFNSSNQP